MNQEDLIQLEELIRNLNKPKDWVNEVNVLSELVDKIKKSGKVVTVRSIAKITNQAKTWVGVSFQLAKGLKVYPEIKGCANREQAYAYLKKKQKMRRFLES